MLSVLIHSELYHRLRQCPAAARSRVRKTLLRLRDGHWGGGTRVKRLAAVNRPVYEARTDSGDRLLFTAIRSADKEYPDRLTTHLQVWDWLHHDEVTRVARRNLAPEAGFLEFQLLEEFDLDEAPPAPAATFDEIDSDGDVLLHFLIPPAEFETRTGEGIAGSVRWYLASQPMLADESEFQRIMDFGGAELELKLTRDQYETLRAPGPALVAGSAGSGKTTIAVHRLADAALQAPGIRGLYLSYSSWLVDHARGLYRDLLIARGADVEQNPPQFLTFTDLYLRLLPPNLRQQHARLVTGGHFEGWLRRSGSPLDASLVWEEIRSILKGACLNVGKPMLDEKDYLELGRKRAPLFVNERPEIYRVGQRYQDWISSQHRWDQIDLCRQALGELRHGRARRYDAIVCDEAQDLTELEVLFVLSLSSDVHLRGVMLSGDAQQIINPSGFRWAEVRQSIMKTDRTRGSIAPAILQLKKNFRSVRPLVDLANAMLALRRECFGRSDGDEPEEAVAEGPAPLEVIDEEQSVLEAIGDFGPRSAIVVFEASEAERLRERLKTTRVFHIHEAKGLEFETVVLWKAMEKESELLARLSRNNTRPATDVHFKQLLQHLYVAVTRARRHLVIFEGAEPHPFWNAERFRGLLESDTAEALPRIFQQSRSLEDWADEGDYYFERKRFRQAAECYRRAGLNERGDEALAGFAESLEDWNDAAARWRRLGRFDREAVALENLGRLGEAADAYRKLGREVEAHVLDARLLERQSRWAEAGKVWEDLGRGEDAMRCYARSGNRARALTFEASQAEALKDWGLAGACWLELKSYEAAARCFKKAKDSKNANLAIAHHQESLKAWDKAAAAYNRSGELEKASECKARALEASGQPLKAAKIWQKMGHREQAAKLYRKYGDQTMLNRMELENVNLREPQLGRAEGFEHKGKFDLAIGLSLARRKFIHGLLPGRLTRKNYEKFRSLTRELAALKDLDHRCRAELAERANNWKKAAYHWRLVWEFEKGAAAGIKAVEALSDPNERGREWLRMRDWKHAIECFREAGNSDGEAEANARSMETQCLWAEAAEHWNSIQRTGDQARCLAQAARLAGDWAAAAGYHRQAGEDAMARSAENHARRAQAAAKRAQLSLFADSLAESSRTETTGDEPPILEDDVLF